MPEHPHLHKLVRSLSFVDIIIVAIDGMIGGAILSLLVLHRSSRHSAIIAFMMNAMNTIYGDDIC